MGGNLLIKTNCIIVISVCTLQCSEIRKKMHQLSTTIAQHLYKILQFLIDHELKRNLSHFECYIIFELNEENYRKILGRRHIFLDEKSVLGGHLSQVHFVN